MLLIDAMESRLSSVETWPTSNLTIIFAFDALMQNAISKLETVIAFFIGNVFPLPIGLSILQRVEWSPFSACKRSIPFFI